MTISSAAGKTSDTPPSTKKSIEGTLLPVSFGGSVLQAKL